MTTIETTKDTKRNLPIGWRWVRLGDLIREAQAGFACGLRDPHGIVQLRMNNLDTRGNFVWDDVLRVPYESGDIDQFLIVPGDVLFNNTNSTELVGKSALFEGYVEPIVYSNHFTRLRTVTEALLPSFLASWLNHQWQQGVFAAICNRWIGQSAVKADKLLSLNFPLPPLSEQCRIAGVLREEIAAVEKARKAVKERQAAAEVLHAAYLRRVFDAPQANNWESRRLGDILIRHNDIIHPGDRASVTAQFVGLEHIEPYTGRRLGSLTLDLAQLTGRKPTFRRGQIVYGYLRPYLNKVWIAEFDGCCSVDQFTFAVQSDVADVEFVAWFMRSPTYLRRSSIMTTTGQLPRIGTEEIAAVEIGLPPLDQQRVIAREINHWFTERQRLCDLIQVEATAIDTLPAALLRQAFGAGL